MGHNHDFEFWYQTGGEITMSEKEQYARDERTLQDFIGIIDTFNIFTLSHRHSTRYTYLVLPKLCNQLFRRVMVAAPTH